MSFLNDIWAQIILTQTCELSLSWEKVRTLRFANLSQASAHFLGNNQGEQSCAAKDASNAHNTSAVLTAFAGAMAQPLVDARQGALQQKQNGCFRKLLLQQL